MMKIQEIANSLVDLLRQKKFLDAQVQLFTIDAISLEPELYKQRSVFGLDAMIIKEKRFLSNIKKWNHFTISEPLLSLDHFTIHMITDVTLKNEERIHIDEIIVYEVESGKIIKEQFFYK
ncbi:SnoaL-like domain-containing protein [Aquimarina sp. AU474]|uniref:SnoaL-like domain-containing protein n=1 Tax=Aquimarina sp. AU474 TaxID=2108529 RepID=UPI001359A8A9|nr:SnoaL-like domain-containing protein [Aquimarina sp. AU474]